MNTVGYRPKVNQTIYTVRVETKEETKQFEKDWSTYQSAVKGYESAAEGYELAAEGYELAAEGYELAAKERESALKMHETAVRMEQAADLKIAQGLEGKKAGELMLAQGQEKIKAGELKVANASARIEILESERLAAEAKLEKQQQDLEKTRELKRTCVLKKFEDIDSLLNKKITAVSNSSAGEGKENLLTELGTLRTKNAALKTEMLSGVPLDDISKNKLPALVQEVNLLNKKIGKI